MTTPPPIPPEAMDGRECLVKTLLGEYMVGSYEPDRQRWDVGVNGYVRDVLLAIPLSWCLAAPGMRSVLQLFHDIQIKNGHHICEEIPGGCPVKIALAACEKDGE